MIVLKCESYTIDGLGNSAMIFMSCQDVNDPISDFLQRVVRMAIKIVNVKIEELQREVGCWEPGQATPGSSAAGL